MRDSTRHGKPNPRRHNLDQTSGPAPGGNLGRNQFIGGRDLNVPRPQETPLSDRGEKRLNRPTSWNCFQSRALELGRRFPGGMRAVLAATVYEVISDL
jgi:hypothetical protein